MQAIPPDTALLPLTRGMKALVDVNVIDHLSQFSWYANVSEAGRVYARAKIKGKAVYLHRYLMGVTDSRVLVDHKDRDTMNNTIDNLRITDASGNAANTAAKPASSRFKGVSLRRGKYRAYIKHDRRQITLGTFEREEDAAQAYDAAAIEIFGPMARTNAMEGLY